MSKIPEYPFESHFHHFPDIRIHYLDEGDKQAPTLILLHGVPTWSYTFRNIIPGVVHAGYRVIAPDLPGFGYSGKPVNSRTVTLAWLRNHLMEFIDQVEPSKPVLFGHDWGAIMGSLLASQMDHPFSGLILCNGFLPFPGIKVPVQFKLWRVFAQVSPVIPVGKIVDAGCKRRLSSRERAAYSAPFRSWREKRTIRRMPRLVPLGKHHREIEMVEKAWNLLEQMTMPVLTIFSDGDPFTRGAEQIVRKRIPGARDQERICISGGHFVQEDSPIELSRIVIGFLNNRQ